MLICLSESSPATSTDGIHRSYYTGGEQKHRFDYLICFPPQHTGADGMDRFHCFGYRCEEGR